MYENSNVIFQNRGSINEDNFLFNSLKYLGKENEKDTFYETENN